MLNNVNESHLKDLLLLASLSNFTLNLTPPSSGVLLHLFLFPKHAKLKLGLGCSHVTVLLAENALASNPGVASCFHYAYFSSNVITSVRTSLK